MCLCLYVCMSMILWKCLCLFLWFFFSLFFSFFQTVTFSLSLSLSLCVCECVSVYKSICLFLCACVCVSEKDSVCVFLSICVCIYVRLCAGVFFCLCLCQCQFLSVWLCLFLYLSVCVCVCVCVYLYVKCVLASEGWSISKDCIYVVFINIYVVFYIFIFLLQTNVFFVIKYGSSKSYLILNIFIYILSYHSEACKLLRMQLHKYLIRKIFLFQKCKSSYMM